MLALVTAVIVAVIQFPLGQPTGATIAALVGIGAALDGARLILGRPGPPTVGRQVPSEWARIFSAPVTAGLYGARLGVGPLTILSTWTWWSFTAAASLLGPAPAAATGATFGLVKLGLVAATSRATDRSTGPSAVMGRLRAGQRPSWIAITLLSLVLAVAASGCGSTPENSAGRDTTSRDAASRDTASRDTAGRPTPTTDRSGTTTGSVDVAGQSDPAETIELIIPAQLEDVVRTDATETNTIEPDELASDVLDGDELDGDVLDGDAPATATDRQPALSDDLLGTVTGYQTIDEPDADRFLDLRAAADIQPDPTEEIALLETRGYRGGWLRAFRNEHNDVAVASVYEFRDEVEAEFYLEDGLITIGGYGGKFFDIPDLPGVRGFAQEITRSDGESTEDLVSLGAAFQRGDRWYLLYFLGSPLRVTPEILVPAIAAQLETAEA